MNLVSPCIAVGGWSRRIYITSLGRNGIGRGGSAVAMTVEEAAAELSGRSEPLA